MPALPGVQTLFTNTVTVGSSQVGRIIGTGGANIKRLTETYEVTIDIPPPDELERAGGVGVVRVSGFDRHALERVTNIIRSTTGHGNSLARAGNQKGGRSSGRVSGRGGEGAGGSGSGNGSTKPSPHRTARLNPGRSSVY